MEIKLVYMNFSFIAGTILMFFIVSCSSSKSRTHSFSNSRLDTLINERNDFLREYALCECVNNGYREKGNNTDDVSPAIYADVLNWWGIDTIAILAKKAAQEIKAEKYQDYKGKKAAFFRCNQWLKKKEIDSLIKQYARSSAQEFLNREKME